MSEFEYKNYTVEQYKSALKVMDMSSSSMWQTQKEMMECQFRATDKTLTATQMGVLLGHKMPYMNRCYGAIGRKISEISDLFPQQRLDGTYRWWTVIATGGRYEEGFRWTLRDNFVQALSELEWFENTQNNDVFEEVEQYQPSYIYLEETERKSVIQSRIGQGQFRKQLINFWGECVITGCDDVSVLRASHIKPWRSSSNEERLDVFNGLLLSPNLDAVFDIGLISFEDDGSILISPMLSEGNCAKLGIIHDMKIAGIRDEHIPYFRYHRQEVFKNYAPNNRK